MGGVSEQFTKEIVIIFTLVLAIPVIVANWYVGFQTWLTSVLRFRLPAPDLLTRCHRPVKLDRRHVLLAFAANSLCCICIVLPLLVWYGLWNLFPWLAILALVIGGNGALGRSKDLKRQKTQDRCDG